MTECRDEGDEEWMPGHIVSVNPLQVQAEGFEDPLEWQECKCEAAEAATTAPVSTSGGRTTTTTVVSTTAVSPTPTGSPYVKITKGTCESNSMARVPRSECLRAAAALGHNVKEVHDAKTADLPFNPRFPTGCWVDEWGGGTLHYNDMPHNYTKIHGGRMVSCFADEYCICSKWKKPLVLAGVQHQFS